LIGSGDDDNGSLHPFFAEVVFDELPNFAIPFPDKCDYVDVGGMVPAECAEQRAFSNAAPSEQADALSDAKRKKRVNDANTGFERPGNPFPRQWVGRYGTEIIECVGNNRLSPIHRFSEPINYAAYKSVTDTYLCRLFAGYDAISELKSNGFIERQGEHAAVAKADDLAANSVSGICPHFAKVAQGRRGPLRFDEEPYHLSHMADPM